MRLVTEGKSEGIDMSFSDEILDDSDISISSAKD